MGYGKVGFGKERMCSYKHTHNSAVHSSSKDKQKKPSKQKSAARFN